jgi:hypothetical protein
MSKNKNIIELRKSTNSEWIQMIINHRLVYEDTHIPDFIWLDVLEDTGFDVSITEYERDEFFD